MKSIIYNATDEAWIDESIQKITNFFHDRNYNPDFYKIYIDEYKKIGSNIEMSDDQFNSFIKVVCRRARTELDEYNNLKSKVCCSDDEVVNFIRQLQNIDNKAAFVDDIINEYYEILDCISLTDHDVDDILHVVFNKNRIETYLYGDLFRNKLVYLISDILQKLNKIILNIKEHHSETILIENKSYDSLIRISVDIMQLHQDMTSAADYIKDKIELLRLSVIKSDAGSSSTRICKSVIQAVINLRKYYNDDTNKILKQFELATIKRPIIIDDYKIYCINDKICEVDTKTSKVDDSDVRKISISTLKRRYIDVYSISKIYIDKYGAKPNCFKWTDSIGHCHNFSCC